jgi:hypothetical protein
VIIGREDWEECFSPGELAVQSFKRIMAPHGAKEMSVVAVSPLVNSAPVDDPRCCEPMESAEVPEKLKITRRSFFPVRSTTESVAGPEVLRLLPDLGLDLGQAHEEIGFCQ